MTASSHGWLASSASDAQWWPWRNRSGRQLPQWWTMASVTQVVPVMSTGNTFFPKIIQDWNHLSQRSSLNQVQSTEDFTAKGQSQSIFLFLISPLTNSFKNILLSPKNVTYQWQWGCKPEGGRGKKCLYLLSSAFHPSVTAENLEMWKSGSAQDQSIGNLELWKLGSVQDQTISKT